MTQNDFYLLKKIAKHHNQITSSQISNPQLTKSLISNNLVDTIGKNFILTSKGHRVFEKILSKKLNPVFIYAFELIDLLILLFTIIFGLISAYSGELSYSTFRCFVLCVISMLFFCSLLIPYLIEKYYKKRYNADINKYIKYFQ